MKRWEIDLVKLSLALLIAAVCQHYATALALAERGYQAMGGEVFVFPVVLLVLKKVFGIGDKEEEYEWK